MAPASDYPIVLFADRIAFRAWLSAHHATRAGLWLRIAKAASPLQSVTYAEALDVALCFGWIDGQKRALDVESFLQKFTPRQKRSPWSKRNREHVERLTAAEESGGGVVGIPTGFIDLDNWRRRDWRPALDAAGLDPALTPYAMRHTYASFALDAGVTIFELARLMGTSVKVIDDTYGHLVRGSFDRVRSALEARARRDAGDTDATTGQATTT